MNNRKVPQVDNRPDLPELEAVEVCNASIFWGIGFYLIWMLFNTTAAVYGYVAFHDYLGKNLALVVAVGSIMVLLSLWVLLGLLLTDFKWETNEQGILARGPLRKRFIRWTEVERISIRLTLSGSTYYILQAKKSTATISTHIAQTSGQGERLNASVWQHLRRLDEFDDLHLIVSAESYWDTIPDELPREMDWENQKSLNWRGHVQKFSLREDHFEAKLPRRSVYIRWSDVTSACWKRNHLIIRACKPRVELCVPFLPKDESSSKLILAIIRRLRTIDRPQAMIIPGLLRSNYQEWQLEQCDTPVTENEVVLKMAWSEKLIISLLVYLFTMFCFIGPLLRNGSPALVTLVFTAAASLLAVFLVTFTVCNSYAIKADNKGVSWQFLWWKRSIDWQEVTEENRFIQQNRTRSLLWQIKGEDSKASITISNDIGAKRDRKKLLLFIQARLSEVLSLEKLDKSWKARPWKPE